MAQGQKSFYYALGAIVIAGGIFLATRLGGKRVVIPANPIVTTADTSGFRGYVLGSPTAPVEVVEYADFQCPQCANFEAVSWPDIKARLIDTGKLRYRYRDMPLDDIHSNTRVGAHAAACGDEQGKFWEMKDVIYRRQSEWALSKSPMKVLKEAAGEAGLDVPKWEACMESAKYAGRIQASRNEADKLGVGSTPTFLIAGRLYPGVISGDELVKIIDSLTAATPAAPAAAPKP